MAIRQLPPLGSLVLVMLQLSENVAVAVVKLAFRWVGIVFFLFFFLSVRLLFC